MAFVLGFPYLILRKNSARIHHNARSTHNCLAILVRSTDMARLLFLALSALSACCVFSQMTFTDNWQKRGAFTPNVYRPLRQNEKSADVVDCEPDMVLEKVREIQRVQKQLEVLTDELHYCAARHAAAPPLYSKNPVYKFPTYLKSKNEEKF